MTKNRWRSSIAAAVAISLVGFAPPAMAQADETTTFGDGFDTLSSAWVQAAGSWDASGGAARVVTPGAPRGSVLAITKADGGEIGS